MALDQKDILKLASMAKLTLTDTEVDLYTKELSSILDYVDLLQSLNTEDIKPTTQIGELANITREDVLSSTPLCSSEALLSCSTLHKEMKQIRVPKVLD